MYFYIINEIGRNIIVVIFLSYFRFLFFINLSANYVYKVAAEFRKRGIPVVLGGPHVSLLPDEAKKHSDIIFIGEAEDTWKQFLIDNEGRILTYDWSKYNGRRDVVFKPKNMTCDELLEGFKWVNSQFYSIKSIGARLSKAKKGLWWTLPSNLLYYFSYKLYGKK